MLNGEFMKRQKKFKSSPWPVKGKEKQQERKPMMFWTPFGMVFEIRGFGFSSIFWGVLIFLCLAKFFAWYAHG